MCGKNVSVYSVYNRRKCIESMHFYSWPSPPCKTSGRIQVGGGDDLLYQNSKLKMTWNISLFRFCMICNFLDVVALQFCK